MVRLHATTLFFLLILRDVDPNEKGHQLTSEVLLPVLKAAFVSRNKEGLTKPQGLRPTHSEQWEKRKRSRVFSNRGTTAKNWELYNLDPDRSETRDVIEVYPNQACRMRVSLERWAKMTGYPLTGY